MKLLLTSICLILVASSSPLVLAQEVCNGLDDDQDGEIDEDLGTYECGIGLCYTVVQACIDGVSQSCVPELQSRWKSAVLMASTTTATDTQTVRT
jgi:hypothetical protein